MGAFFDPSFLPRRFLFPLLGCLPFLAQRSCFAFHHIQVLFLLINAFVFFPFPLLSAGNNAGNPTIWSGPQIQIKVSPCSCPEATTLSALPTGVCLDHKTDRSEVIIGVQEERDTACTLIFLFYRHLYNKRLFSTRNPFPTHFNKWNRWCCTDVSQDKDWAPVLASLSDQ